MFIKLKVNKLKLKENAILKTTDRSENLECHL